MADYPLGRLVPTDWKHVDKYPISALPVTQLPEKVPVVLGVNWYSNFDTPVQDSDERWWIGRDARNLGSIRGGHCVCLKPSGIDDPMRWYRSMDQGSEGACVGFGSTRAMMLLNRRRYDARWLYHEAQKVDEWPGEGYSGTSVRAAMDILRDVGHRRVFWSRTRAPNLTDGISANRWATNVAEVMDCLNSSWYDQLGAVAVLNSWGESYPHIVYMPFETLARLLREDGEATIIVDR